MIDDRPTPSKEDWYRLAEQVPQDTNGEAYVLNFNFEGGTGFDTITGMSLLHDPSKSWVEFDSMAEYDAWLVDKGYKEATA